MAQFVSQHHEGILTQLRARHSTIVADAERAQLEREAAAQQAAEGAARLSGPVALHPLLYMPLLPLHQLLLPLGRQVALLRRS